MKYVLKILMAISIMLICCVGVVFALGNKEQASEEAILAKMGVMQGPTGFGTAALSKNGGKISSAVTVDVSVYPSPNEVVARLTNGELDIAALPSNLAANLYNKGVPIKIAAIIGEGMLSILSSDPSITSFEHVSGKTVSVPGAGSTPDQMIQYLAQETGVNVSLDYSVAAPAQVAQMLIGGRIETAILPEPFVTMVLTQDPQVFKAIDVQSAWSQANGAGNYPMTVLVVSDAFRTNYPKAWADILGAVEDSIDWVVTNPQDAGVIIEELGIMQAAMAVPAIPNCNFVFRSARDAQQDVLAYFTVLSKLAPASIGGTVPNEGIFLAQ